MTTSVQYSLEDPVDSCLRELPPRYRVWRTQAGYSRVVATAWTRADAITLLVTLRERDPQ